MIRRKAIQAVAKRFAKRSSKTFKRMKKRSSKTFKRVKKSVIKKVKYLKLSKAERQALKKRCSQNKVNVLRRIHLKKLLSEVGINNDS